MGKVSNIFSMHFKSLNVVVNHDSSVVEHAIDKLADPLTDPSVKSSLARFIENESIRNHTLSAIGITGATTIVGITVWRVGNAVVRRIRAKQITEKKGDNVLPFPEQEGHAE